jgi:ATP-dependent DNA helicase PIF1
VELVKNDESMKQAKLRIQQTDVIVIDEISMLSSKLFLDIDYLFREIRESSVTFGGMQTILVGDFYQLSPVPNVHYSDFGEFAFKNQVFRNGFAHRVNLTAVIRQDEPDLIQVLLFTVLI